MVQLIRTLSDWSPFLPLIIGVKFFYSINTESRIITFISAIAFLTQLFHFLLPNSHFQNYAYNFYTPIEFGCYFMFFYSRMKKDYALVNKVILLIYAMICIFFIINFNLGKQFVNQWPIVNSIMYIIFICLLVISTFKKDDDILLPKNGLFWYVTGILEFSVCTCLVYLFWQQILKSEPGSNFKLLFTVQNIFNISLYIFFSIGILKSTRHKLK